MLTKNIKWKKQVSEAIKETKKVSKRLRKGKKSKRKTKLTRISSRWYDRIKIEAREKKVTMSKTLDEICFFYFKPLLKNASNARLLKSFK